MTIYERLSDIQLRLKAPKSQYNSFGKYNYRNCEDILEAVKPLLSEHKLFINISDTVEYIGERYYIKATVTLSDGENSISSHAYAREEEMKKGMDSSQVTGASSSYARKYALNGMFAIDDTKDSDVTNIGEKDKHKEKKKEYKCACCGSPFTDFTWNGKHYTADQAYEISERKNGKPLCQNCVEKKKSGQINIDEL
jgi:hypothetical protein